MSRIEKTARVWIAQTFDASVNAIEAGDPARVERIERAKKTLESFVNSLPTDGGR